MKRPLLDWWLYTYGRLSVRVFIHIKIIYLTHHICEHALRVLHNILTTELCTRLDHARDCAHLMLVLCRALALTPLPSSVLSLEINSALRHSGSRKP